MNQDQDCYNPRCVSPAHYRCVGYGTCGHRGCTDHLPLIETSEGIRQRLCGECRVLRWVFVPGEYHIMDGIPREN